MTPGEGLTTDYLVSWSVQRQRESFVRDAQHLDRCPSCDHLWHGTPCRWKNHRDERCPCQTAFEEAQ